MATINFHTPLKKAHNTFFRLNFRSKSKCEIFVSFIAHILLSLFIAFVFSVGGTFVYKFIKCDKPFVEKIERFGEHILNYKWTCTDKN